MIGYGETGIPFPKCARQRQSDGAFWRTDTLAFEAFSAPNVALYGIPAVEIPGTGVYLATDPAPAVEGGFLLVAAVTNALAVADLATGQRWQDRAGPTAALSAAGLDGVVIEVGLNLRQAVSIMASALAGVLAGANSTAVTIAAAGVPAVNRISAVVDAAGDRTAVTLNPPA